MLYGVPLAGLITGIFLGRPLSGAMNLPAEITSALCGIIMMLAALAGVRSYKPAKRKGYKPKISKV